MINRDISYSLLCCAIGSAIVFIGASFGCDFVKPNKPAGFIDSFAQWDGQHYRRIIDSGYDYDPSRRSEVAFFPGYPVLAGALALITGLATVPALLIVSNLCTLAALVLMGVYLREREALPEAGGLNAAGFNASARDYALLALALFPTTFFFRMAYSESLFVCVAILCMLAIRRNWSLAAIAALAGLATAVRPTGVALILPIVWHICKTSKNRADIFRQLSYAVPLACWGLAAYIGFQAWLFGEPWAFIQTQEFWRFRPPAPASEKFWSLVSWQPVWGAYFQGSADFWREPEGIANPLFSLAAANPIYFVGTAAAILLGAWKRWLTMPEVLLSALLLFIPYAARGYETCMASQGRFAAVVFPMYIVLGQLLSRLPAVVAAVLLVFSAFLMAAYAALFAAGYSFI